MPHGRLIRAHLWGTYSTPLLWSMTSSIDPICLRHVGGCFPHGAVIWPAIAGEWSAWVGLGVWRTGSGGLSSRMVAAAIAMATTIWYGRTVVATIVSSGSDAAFALHVCPTSWFGGVSDRTGRLYAYSTGSTSGGGRAFGHTTLNPALREEPE